MALIYAPIVEGRTEAWQAWIRELAGPRKAELDAFNRRHGLTRHTVWFVPAVDGDAVVVLVEGDGADTYLEAASASSDPFDRWFTQQVAAMHGEAPTRARHELG